MTADIAVKVDQTSFGSGAGSATTPGGLFRLPTLVVAASSDTPKSEAMAADADALIAAIMPTAGNEKILFVAAPAQAPRLERYFQNLPRYEVFCSSALADKTVLAIASNALASALGPPRFDVTSRGALHLDSVPADLIGSGGTTSAGGPVTSLDQTDVVAVKTTLEINFGQWLSGGVASMSAVTW